MQRLPGWFTVMGVACLTASVLAGEITWVKSFDEAVKTARKDHRPIMVFFSRPGCGLCRHVEATTLPDRAVADVLGKVVCVKLNIDDNRELMLQLARPKGGFTLPLITLTDANKAHLGFTAGPVKPAQLVEQLKAAIQKLGPQLTPAQINQIDKQYAQALEHIEAGRPDQALPTLRRIANLGGVDPRVEAARKKHAELVARADDQLKLARDKIEANDYAPAATLLCELHNDYPGTQAARTAKALLLKLERNPKAARAIEQAAIQRAARRALDEAQELEQHNKPKSALRAYKRLVQRYPDAQATKAATERIDALQKLLAEREQRAPDAYAKARLHALLNVARSLAANGKNDDAIAYYNKVIQAAPDSPEAAQARAAVAELKKR